MIFESSIYKYMHEALTEATVAFEKEEVPVGAVVVYKNRIIGKGHNQTLMLNDSTAHAEMIALTAASSYLNTTRLRECELYVTLEPCIMCIGATLLSRVGKLYFGAFDSKFGACGSLYNLAENSSYNRDLKVYSGVLESESKELLRSFFKKRRNIGKY